MQLRKSFNGLSTKWTRTNIIIFEKHFYLSLILEIIFGMLKTDSKKQRKWNLNSSLNLNKLTLIFRRPHLSRGTIINGIRNIRLWHGKTPSHQVL